MPRFVPMTATILAGESLSSPIDCSTGTPVMIYMPHEWTSAHLSFQVSPDGTNYNDLFDSDGHELHSSVTYHVYMLGFLPGRRYASILCGSP